MKPPPCERLLAGSLWLGQFSNPVSVGSDMLLSPTKKQQNPSVPPGPKCNRLGPRATQPETLGRTFRGARSPTASRPLNPGSPYATTRQNEIRRSLLP